MPAYAPLYNVPLSDTETSTSVSTGTDVIDDSTVPQRDISDAHYTITKTISTPVEAHIDQVRDRQVGIDNGEYDNLIHNDLEELDIPLEETGLGSSRSNRSVTPGEDRLEHQARWYHAGFHITTVIIGTGVLGLPGAMARLTWVPGMVILCLAYIASYYTAILLSRMHLKRSDHNSNPTESKRLNTYLAIGESVFGKTLAKWSIVPFQYTVLIGTSVAYLIAAGENGLDIYLANCHKPCTPLKLLTYTTVMAALELVLCLFPSLESISIISLIAALASLIYCVIAVSLSAWLGKQPGVSYAPVGATMGTQLWDSFQGISTMVFAYGVHVIIPEIQATMRPVPSPVKENIKGISMAWACVLVLYFSSAVAGYWAFGNTVQSNILKSIQRAETSTTVNVLLTISSALVVLHVVIAYQVVSMPVYAAMENWVRARNRRFAQNPKLYRIPIRFMYVGVTWFIAIAIPFFGDIMSLFGAIGMTPLVFILPGSMYLAYRGDKISFLSAATCYTIVICGVMIVCVGTISSVRQIVIDSHTFKLFS